MRFLTVTYLINNYGSVLQAYALQNVLKDNSAEPVIVKMKNRPAGRKAKAKKYLRVLKSGKNYTSSVKLKMLLQEGRFSEKEKKIRRFINDRLSVLEVGSAREAAREVKDSDVLLAGSDQIWTHITGPNADWYTFKWPGLSDDVKRVSYAASASLTELSDAQKDEYHRALRDFSCVSFREQQSVDLLRSYLSAPVRCDLDPTLLFDKERWSEIAAERIESSPYVFIYMLRPDTRLIEMGKRYAAEHNCKVIYTGLMADNYSGVETVCSAGAEEFLSYIKYADAVITNSFHGMAFSILFEKQFISVQLSSTNSRALNLLNKLGLTDRQIKTTEEISKLNEKIDYLPVKERLEAERASSLGYIKQICSGEIFKKPVKKSYFDTGHSSDCRGCTACSANCPVNAISMTAENGFVYPEIDEEKCIHCNKCVKTCEKTLRLKSESENTEVYYGWHSDKDKRWQSTSGGAFSSIVDAYTKEYPEAWVYGAVYNDEFYVIHTGTQDKNVISDMCRSKYLQSNIEGIYDEIKERIKNKQRVLFSGTPCQVAGLRAVTGDSEYLLTVDFICHGVSNPLYFSEYIKGLGEKKNSPVTSYSFRNKTDKLGKKSYRLISLKYENGDSELTDNDLYVMSYKYRMFYRSSCYNCEFARTERCSDITLGDFWGLEKKIPALQSERLKGISMVMLNTDKARSFKDKLSEFFESERFNGDFTAYAHLFRPSAPCGIRMKEYSDEMSFIDYLSDTITPKMRMMYTHPKAAWLLRRL